MPPYPVEPFYLGDNTTLLLLLSLWFTLFSLQPAHYSCVKWGRNLCVCVAPPMLMSTRFVPSVQNRALKANVLIHKVEWTTLSWFMDATYRTRIALHLCRSSSSNRCLVLMVFTSPASALNLGFGIRFPLFSSHVLNESPTFSTRPANRKDWSSVSISPWQTAVDKRLPCDSCIFSRPRPGGKVSSLNSLQRHRDSGPFLLSTSPLKFFFLKLKREHDCAF